MAVRLIFGILSPKTKWFLLCRHDVRVVHEKFSSRRFDRGIWLLDSFWHPEPKRSDSFFVDMIYVEFMKNFLLADSCELMAVRLISASWAQKQLIPTCRHDVRRVHEKFLLAFERAAGCYTHFGILSTKTSDSYFVDMMYVEFMKIFFSPIRAGYMLLDSFWPPEPKNKWLLLCRHDVRRVHEKFSPRRFERGISR